MNCKCNNDILTIPKGNPFRLFICSSIVVPGTPNADFTEVEELKAYIVRFPGKMVEVEYELSGSSDIIISIPADIQICSTYGIELIGTYNGHPWRWRANKAFRIVNSNDFSNVQDIETFGTETYYLRDVLWVEVDEDTMYFTTHGHASIIDGTLTLQSTVDTDVNQEGDTLVINTKRR